MSPAARSIQLFGVYLLGMGLTLIAVPNVLLGVLGLPAAEDPWIRVLGVVAMVLSTYYLAAARSESASFFGWTVPGRIVAGSGIIVVMAVWGYWPALAFGAVDIAAALWTRSALQRPAPAPGRDLQAQG